MKRPLFAAAVILVAAVWAGLAAGVYPLPGRTDTGQEMELEQEVPWHVTGQVCRKEEDKIWIQSVIIDESNPYAEKLICELAEEGRNIPLGSKVSVKGIFAPFRAAGNPGEFDTAAYYRSLGAGGRLKKARVLEIGGEYWRVREALYQLRLHIKRRLYQVFPEREATVMCALLLGEKGDIDSGMKELYKRNGILHILSISSLHITIIGMSLYRLLRRTGLPAAPCAGVGGAVLVLYGMMTGFSVSACRAVGMYLIRMLGEICGRTYDMLTAMGILAAGMVLINPYYLQNAGFLMSFLAVLGIGTVYPALNSGESPALILGQRRLAVRRYGENPVLPLLRQAVQKLKQAALASLSITLATLPVQLWFYNETPVFGVLLNLMVIPLMKPVLITGLLSLIPGFGAAGWVGRLTLRWYEGLCSLFDKIPFGVWNPGRPEIWQIAVYYGVLLGALALRGRLRRHTGQGSPAAFGVILAAAVLVLAIRPAAKNRVIFLDVGQGDCCLVQTASGVNYLFDCGSSSRSLVGQYVLLPALKYYGIHRLDAIFLSHPDTDHMNGIMEIIKLAGDNRLTVGQVILPAVEESAREEAFGEIIGSLGEGIRAAYLGAGEEWECGSVRFLCLNPPKGCTAAEGNAYSECIYADFGSFTLLLTGDVEKEGEENLLAELKSRKIESVTLLKAAHHGSRGATSEKLLEQLRPRAVIISCGQNNRYGHPHEEVLERLRQTGSYVFRTDLGGAVIVRENGKNVEAGYYQSSLKTDEAALGR